MNQNLTFNENIKSYDLNNIKKILKMEKKKRISKKIFIYHPIYQNVIVTSKVIRRRQQRSIDRKGILKQGVSE